MRITVVTLSMNPEIIPVDRQSIVISKNGFL